MNRILALQGMAEIRIATNWAGDSNQSHHCSSATSECSTQSAGCKPPIIMAVAW